MRATCEPWNSAVRYGPGSRPLCGAEGRFAIHTQDPALATGCADCLELAAEALGGNNRCAATVVIANRRSRPKAESPGGGRSGSPARMRATRVVSTHGSGAGRRLPLESILEAARYRAALSFSLSPFPGCPCGQEQ